MTHEHDQDTAVLSVQGEIDLRTAPMLRDALLPVLDQRSGPVLVDLCEVPFMDSTGVHVLLDALHRLESADRRLAIACRQGGQVARILGLVGLLEAVGVHRAADGELFRPERSGRAARQYFGNMRPPARTLPATPTPQRA